jgi:hypothetical protein
VGDAQAAGHIDWTRLAAGRQQIGDQFNVVFKERPRSRRPDLAEAPRRSVGSSASEMRCLGLAFLAIAAPRPAMTCAEPCRGPG